MTGWDDFRNPRPEPLSAHVGGVGMIAPERIWICRHGGKWSNADGGTQDTEYIRRDPAVIVALPDVQALIQQSVEIVHVQAFVEGREAGIAAEREACATLMDQSHIDHMARKGRDPARYSSVWSVAAAAIRKRGDTQ